MRHPLCSPTSFEVYMTVAYSKNPPSKAPIWETPPYITSLTKPILSNSLQFSLLLVVQRCTKYMVSSNLQRSEFYNSQSKYMSRKPCSVAHEQGSIPVVQCPLLLAMLGLQVWWRYCACCGKGTTARVTRGCRWRCILQSTSLRPAPGFVCFNSWDP